MKVLFFILLGTTLYAAEESQPKWDFGIGFGGVRFEQYPASDQYTQLALPIPTFEYRGDILYADDRDGAQIFLFRSEKLKLEISGFGYPPLDSSENSARKGMEDLPALLALGPQLLYKPVDWLELILGYYESLSLAVDNQKASGSALQMRAVLNHEWKSEILSETKIFNRLFFTSRFGSRKLQALYYDVENQDATATRTQFRSRSGLLSQELGYLLQFQKLRWNTYVGWAYTDYSDSANKKSPLFLTEQAFTFFIGVNYILKESKN